MIERVPLFVGVTGHRVIAPADEAAVRTAFGLLLDRVERELPHTRLVLLTALAPGADLLAAEEAQARGMAVAACLPFSLEAYEATFAAADLVRFRAVLAACARVEVIPAADLAGGYAAVGAHVAHMSQIVVAFWDGTPSRGRGGTADTVRLRLTGLRDPGVDESLADIPYAPDIGPVAQIVTPRAGEPRPAGALATRWIYPRRHSRDASAESDFHAALARLDRCNADLARDPAPAGASDPLERLAVAADLAAAGLQRRTLAFLVGLYVFALIAAAGQIVLGSEMLKLGTLLLAFVAYLFVRRNDFENRYQDYRAFADGLRVQIAWNDAGLRRERVETQYLRTQQGDLAWIRMALRSACDWYRPAQPPDERRALDWVRGQWSYFYRASRRQAGYARACGLAVRGAAVLALAVGIATALVLPEVRWFAAAIALGATTAALIGSYAEKRGFAVNARRYERMFVVFDRARRRLRSVARGGPGSVAGIVGELGREALVEQADWLLIRRDRPVSFVQS